MDQIICLGFVAYVLTHLLFYTYSLIRNKKNNSESKHIGHKIKPTVLIILSQEKFTAFP